MVVPTWYSPTHRGGTHPHTGAMHRPTRAMQTHASSTSFHVSPLIHTWGAALSLYEEAYVRPISANWATQAEAAMHMGAPGSGRASTGRCPPLQCSPLFARQEEHRPLLQCSCSAPSAVLLFGPSCSAPVRPLVQCSCSAPRAVPLFGPSCSAPVRPLVQCSCL